MKLYFIALVNNTCARNSGEYFRKSDGRNEEMELLSASQYDTSAHAPKVIHFLLLNVAQHCKSVGRLNHLSLGSLVKVLS